MADLFGRVRWCRRGTRFETKEIDMFYAVAWAVLVGFVAATGGLWFAVLAVAASLVVAVPALVTSRRHARVSA